MSLVRKVYKHAGPKYSEARNVWFVATPGLGRGHVIKGMYGQKVVDKSSILKGIIPICLGEIGINEHGTYFVKEGAVHVLCYTVLLGDVRHCDFMLDPFLLKELLGVCPSVLSSTIGAKSGDSGTGFKLSSCNKSF
jgi:hypothetical protein